MDRDKILVIGSGPAGLSGALLLAEQGASVVLVEKERLLGGRPGRYSCKAGDGCLRCGACLVADKSWRVKGHDKVEVILESRLIGWSRKGGFFKAEVAGPSFTFTVECRGALVATGFDPLVPARFGEFGYGRVKKVITAWELELMLKEAEDWEVVLGPLPRVAFIQCVGSRDARRGVPYCSRVCCLYAEKMGRALAWRVPGASIDVFYIDRQSYDPVVKVSGEGLNYLRAIPTRLVEGKDGEVVAVYESLDGKVSQARYDWVVLCTALVPGKGTAELCELMGLERDERGFIATVQGVETGLEGVVAAGSCTGPKTILESIVEGELAASRLLSRVGL